MQSYEYALQLARRRYGSQSGQLIPILHTLGHVRFLYGKRYSNFAGTFWEILFPNNSIIFLNTNYKLVSQVEQSRGKMANHELALKYFLEAHTIAATEFAFLFSAIFLILFAKIKYYPPSINRASNYTVISFSPSET